LSSLYVDFRVIERALVEPSWLTRVVDLELIGYRSAAIGVGASPRELGTQSLLTGGGAKASAIFAAKRTEHLRLARRQTARLALTKGVWQIAALTRLRTRAVATTSAAVGRGDAVALRALVIYHATLTQKRLVRNGASTKAVTRSGARLTRGRCRCERFLTACAGKAHSNCLTICRQRIRLYYETFASQRTSGRRALWVCDKRAAGAFAPRRVTGRANLITGRAATHPIDTESRSTSTGVPALHTDIRALPVGVGVHRRWLVETWLIRELAFRAKG
jgi:hypothetical protein